LRRLRLSSKDIKKRRDVSKTESLSLFFDFLDLNYQMVYQLEFGEDVKVMKRVKTSEDINDHLDVLEELIQELREKF